LRASSDTSSRERVLTGRMRESRAQTSLASLGEGEYHLNTAGRFVKPRQSGPDANHARMPKMGSVVSGKDSAHE
ncbi:MAG: hypothetical protein QOE10_1571, partial [Gaiellales bacterium]|nr:hypothetical protein [Gaiellales bacterium]